jgi:hypothetical protein
MTADYLYTFLQTCALEFPFYAYFLTGPWSRRAAAVVALNAFTHPIVFFVLMSALKIPLVYALGIGELFAFGFEAWACFYFLRLSPKRALLAATTANLASWQLGPILTYGLFFS